MPNFPAEDIVRIATDVMTVFTPEYVKAFPAQVVLETKRRMTKEASKGDGEEWQLRKPPKPDEPLLEGFFEKRGAVRTNWKKRYFVAMNKADNFVVYYFAAEGDKGDPKKAKGVMRLDGYKVKKVNGEDEKKNLGCGDFGLKMTCGRRRAWYVRFEDDEKRKEWKAVFKHASKKAKPPMNEDRVLRSCFLVAYRRLRWHFSYWGWWYPSGTEEEQLAQLIVDECERECMGPVYREINDMSPTLRRKVEAKVQEMLDKSIGAVVGSAWKACLTTIAGMKDPVQKKIEEQIQPIIETQIEFKTKIKDAIMNTVTPILEKVANPVMEPVMTHLLDPIFEAYIRNMEIFSQHMQELGGKDSSEHKKEIKRLLRRADYYWSYMHDSYAKLHKLTRSDGMQILSELCSGIYRWTIEDRIEDDLRLMQKKALYTFWDDLQKEEETTPETFSAVVAATLEKMAHDSKMAVLNAFVGILMDGLSTAFKRDVIPAVQEIVSPIADAVPAFVKDPPFLDINGLVEEILMETLEDACRAVVRPSADPRNDAFDRLIAGSA